MVEFDPLRGCAEGRFQIINLQEHDTAAAVSAADDSGERARGQYSRNGGLGVMGGLEASRLNGGLLDLLPVIVSCDKHTIGIAKLYRGSVNTSTMPNGASDGPNARTSTG